MALMIEKYISVPGRKRMRQKRQREYGHKVTTFLKPEKKIDKQRVFMLKKPGGKLSPFRRTKRYQ